MSWIKSKIWDGSFLQKVINSNRLAHAYIFLGKDQQKKIWASMCLAKTVFCDNQSGSFCGKCSSCLKIEHGNHPDFYIMRPLGAMRIIKMEMARALQSFLSLKSYEGGKKIAIIIDADRMRDDVANAMLKTIEEPPDNTILILISDDIEGILPTIVSRCQQVYFPLSSSADVADYLMSESKIQSDKASLIASISQGNFASAIKYTDDSRRDWRDYVMDSMACLLNKSVMPMELSVSIDAKINEIVKKTILDSSANSSGINNMVDELDELEKKAVEKSILNEEVSGLMCFFESLCRDSIIYNETQNKDLIVNIDKLSLIGNISSKIGLSNSYKFVEEIQKAHDAFRGNTNLQFALDILFDRFQAYSI